MCMFVFFYLYIWKITERKVVKEAVLFLEYFTSSIEHLQAQK